ncbi:hypothetical protein Barb4_03749 [Bacteroidales bacterium Barb4]|nr:hypothetical protein Barb4_03749 [Bacteroidales bacterium Barb4]
MVPIIPGNSFAGFMPPRRISSDNQRGCSPGCMLPTKYWNLLNAAFRAFTRAAVAISGAGPY